MTLKVRSPFPFARPALSFLLFITFLTVSGPVTTWAKGKRASAPAPKKSAREDKRRGDSRASARDEKRKDSRRETRAEKRQREREEREARTSAARGRDRDKSSARDRRSAKEDARDNRRMSRRERLAEARRLAEERRREIEEARRRAEEARRAAIARQRAIEQAMRDEVAANVLKDDTTGEDLEVRRAAVAALGNHIGTVVVMNPKTGRVYTVVNQDWALRKGFKPCSTIKLVTGLAGLSENVISPETVNIASVSYRLDLTDALAYSNNGFFQNVGGQVGFDKIVTYARQLGLGERTGINHANEYAGRLPIYKSGWAVNRMCSHGDDFEVTPIQLATLTSAIANGGDLLVPHLPRTPQEDVQFKREVRRHLNIPEEALKRIVPGMIGSVSYGSGKKAYDPYQTVAGKTGTCIGQGGWLGLFTSYAPVYDPQMAIAVVMRGPDARGHVSARVAGDIYKALNHRFSNVPPSQIANTPIPRPKINPKAAAALNDEDKEEREAETAGVTDEADAAKDATGSATNTGASQNNVRTTTMAWPARKSTETTAPATRPQSAPSTSTPSDGGSRPRRVLTNQEP
jgi:membrane peptidoglycan carboxypeptidase